MLKRRLSTKPASVKSSPDVLTVKPSSAIRRCEKSLGILRRVLTRLTQDQLLSEMQDAHGTSRRMEKNGWSRTGQIRKQDRLEKKTQVTEKIKQLEQELLTLQMI